MVRWESEHNIGDRVTVDGCDDLRARITQVLFKAGHPLTSTFVCEYECSWIHNGDAKSAWLQAWRIEKIKVEV